MLKIDKMLYDNRELEQFNMFKDICRFKFQYIQFVYDLNLGSLEKNLKVVCFS